MDIQTEQLLTAFLKEFKNILHYWGENGIDEENGGFYGEADFLGKPFKKAPKGIVLNARILWTFSAAYNFLKNEEYLHIANRAYEYIKKYFWDNQYGGLFWSVSYNGKILDARKQIYAQGFGIYGFSEYFRASANTESLEYAKKLFNLIEKHSYDPVNGGYIEALSRDWKQMKDMRLSEKDANEPKSMNTHLHIIEPYTNLFSLWPDANLSKQIRDLISVFLDHIIDSETGHFILFFEMDWKVKSNMVSYGHDIEGTWLLCEAAETLGDKKLIKNVESAVLLMINAIINEGVAPDGSLYYENDFEKDKFDKERHWWVQAEALVGFINAWQITGNTLYLEKMKAVWQFIVNKIIDKQNGEWFLRIDNYGNPVLSDPKIGFWKCPYHNSRALIEAFRRISLTS